MSDQDDWDFAGADDAKLTIRAAVRYLLQGAAGSDRGDIAREIIEMVSEVARGLLIPTFVAKFDFWTMVVAIFGTTISPYLFFWQASQEVEEMSRRFVRRRHAKFHP